MILMMGTKKFLGYNLENFYIGNEIMAIRMIWFVKRRSTVGRWSRVDRCSTNCSGLKPSPKPKACRFTCRGFAEVEVDVETGQFTIVDYLCVADVGTVVNPRGMEAQLHGGAIQGISYVATQKWVYDRGLTANG